MRLSFRLKHYFFNAFREMFVHHHGSLEFRAKLFALVIAANDTNTDDIYDLVKEMAIDIYDNDEDRLSLLMITIKEKVNKVRESNGLDIDVLISSIQKDLKVIPRYAKKIDIEQLTKLLAITYDPDTLSYQKNIIEFLQNLKDETLQTKKDQIDIDEKILEDGIAK